MASSFHMALLLMALTWLCAGNRLGAAPEYRIIEITFTTPSDRDRLLAGDFIIDAISSEGARLYVYPDDQAALTAAGFSQREIPLPKIEKKNTEKSQLGQYHSYAEVLTFLTDAETAFPLICQVITIGQSVEGRDLRAIKITDNPGLEEDEPEFKYVAAIHGDEIMGIEMCLYFIDHLLSNYGSDPDITNLIDTTEIWILPVMNPDGRVSLERFNANGYDLNRSFPDGFNQSIGNIFDGPPPGISGLQPEVEHVMNWSTAHSFVLSANFHGGALVANYPYDNDGLGSVDSPSPDDLLFEFLARTYTVHNLPMWHSPVFQDGISNGAEWYSIDGGMQDWNYRYLSCNEITMEISNQKVPPQSQIPQFWNDNRDSMMAYLGAVHLGLRGVITDGDTGEPVFAKVSVAGNTQAVYTDPEVGDYHRMLLPGTYTLTYSAPGYVSQTFTGLSATTGPATRQDVTLLQVVRPDFDEDGIPDGEDPDDDNDGMPDSWEYTYELDPFSSSDALLDADHDGLDNLGEYLAGTLPEDGSSLLQITGISISESQCTLTWSSVPGRTYRITRSESLPGPFLPLAEGIVALPEQTTQLVNLSAGESKGYYRVEVE